MNIDRNKILILKAVIELIQNVLTKQSNIDNKTSTRTRFSCYSTYSYCFWYITCSWSTGYSPCNNVIHYRCWKSINLSYNMAFYWCIDGSIECVYDTTIKKYYYEKMATKSSDAYGWCYYRRFDSNGNRS